MNQACKNTGLIGVFIVIFAVICGAAEHVYKYPVHDLNRPQPKIITPGATSAHAPSDAIVLFDGKDLSKWNHTKGDRMKWAVQNGYFEVVPKAGVIRTKDSFGSCQLHVEWAAPEVVKGHSQGRGNSGIFLMGLYEIQVLDCFENPTYPDGQAGSVYSQNPPLVNACRKPGQWQSYDIIFHAPKFNEEKLLKPATITLLHNGVLVQDHWVLTGPTAHKKRQPYKAHPAKLPLSLQDHGNPVRFRNIWIRPLAN